MYPDQQIHTQRVKSAMIHFKMDVSQQGSTPKTFLQDCRLHEDAQKALSFWFLKKKKLYSIKYSGTADIINVCSCFQYSQIFFGVIWLERRLLDTVFL